MFTEIQIGKFVHIESLFICKKKPFMLCLLKFNTCDYYLNRNFSAFPKVSLCFAAIPWKHWEEASRWKYKLDLEFLVPISPDFPGCTTLKKDQPGSSLCCCNNTRCKTTFLPYALRTVFCMLTHTCWDNSFYFHSAECICGVCRDA